MQQILSLENLKTFFDTREGLARAVNGVSLKIGKGEILGVVGESGCGKSITALSILRLVPHPGRVVSGRVLLQNIDLLSLPANEIRQIRGDRVSMIFQEPMISLNPAFTIGSQLMEAIRVHRKISLAEARHRAIEMLRRVEISAAEKRLKDYPHHLSGGMRQRVMIAEAMLLNPDVLLADEPTTALDVTIQAQVLDVMYRLTQERGTAIMLITHNLGIVAESARRVVVMYAGKVVESGPVKEVFESSTHPYTQGLLRSIPVPGHRKGRRGSSLYELGGIVPSLFALPAGCPFHPRCNQRKAVCSVEEPPWCEVDTEHGVLCWHYS